MIEFKVEKKSFTLIEMVIVVAIIIIMAAITIPNIRRQRIDTNEAAAISGLKTLHSALETYKDIFSVYPADLRVLANSTPAFIPPILVTICPNSPGFSEHYQGYLLCYTRSSANNYTYSCSADPFIVNVTGIRRFRLTKSGIIEVRQPSGNWTPLE